MKKLEDSIVLIVDDTEANLDILVETLGDAYDIRVTMDGESALEYIKKEEPDIVLLDIMMPGLDGYEVCRILKANPKFTNIPIIFLTAINDDDNEARGLKLGALDYITKPFNPLLVKARVKNQLELKLHKDSLEDIVRERTRELVLTQDTTLICLASLAESRDPETGRHILRTQNYVFCLAKTLQKKHKNLNLDDNTIEMLRKSAPLHDIGKVGVRDSILLKPGKLKPEEYEEMKKHTLYGARVLKRAEDMLGSNAFLRCAHEIAESHHEKWDGSGYPFGKKASAIPLSGRIMALADVYDSLITRRVYKAPFSHAKAKAIISETAGSHFDPMVHEAFLEAEEEFINISRNLADPDQGA